MISHMEANQSNGNNIIDNNNNGSFNQHSFNQIQIQKEKEDKIAAAKLKLKKFKKEAKTSQSSYNSGNQENFVEPMYNRDTAMLHVETSVTHESTYTSGRSTPASNLSGKQYENGNTSQKSPFPYTSLTDSSNFNNQTDYLKEQLQLHVQTIGILVAEKTELHSKLQQTIKKCDKAQDDNDELLGRLKASRQKINDLERLVDSQHDQLQNRSLNSLSNSPSFESPEYIERLKSELNSMQSVNEELRMRLNDSIENTAQKERENQQLQKSGVELKSQMELLNIKLTQFSMNGSADRKVENYLSDVDDRILNELKERNAYLEAKLKENEQSLLRQRDEIKSEYQNFVDQLQHQIESLVDQINRMTDERETAFAKLDSLETMLNKSNNQNDTLISDFNELKKKYDEAILAGPSNSTDNNESDSNGSSNKEQLLENEIKYFKQQIEILVQDHNGLIKLVDEKEQAITNFNKLIENYESERGQHSTLLDQAHNDKQALSRALQQNKDLKKQLEELQDAFVNVTQQNLDLTTKLQAEEFKAKQIAEAEEVKIEQSTVFSNADEVNGQPIVNENEVEERKDLSDESGEWGEGENEEKIELSKDSTSDESLMDGIKKRIQDLEKENKDLNDYIALVNRELEKNSEAAKKSDDAKNKDNQHSLEQEEIIDRQLRKIEDLNENIKALEDERTKLNENLKDYESKMAESSKQIETVDSKVEDIKVNSSQSDLHSANFKLLEEKFTKVMKENADLKDKNQELEHTILQLQCETDTIVDYITMYQVERKKLNQKYKEKDESIRSLSTQLQLNKLALSEISNYLSAFMKFSEPPEKKIKLPQKEDTTEGQDSIENELTEIEQIEDSLNEIEKVADQEFQKKQHLLTEMEKLLNTLTQDSNNTLNKVNSAVIDNKKINSAHETHNGHGHSHNHKALHNKSIDDSSVKNFRSEIILCSSCDGELFIV